MIDKMASQWKWVALLALAIFFVAFMGTHSLTVPDEGRYPEAAREMLLSGDFITPRVNGVVFMDKPALYYWLEAGAMALFGVNAWAIRLAPALFGLLGCLMVLQAGARIYDRRTGVVAALILATSPLYYLASGYADMDQEVAVLLAGITLTFARTRFETPGSPRYRHLLWFSYLLMGLAFLTKGLMAVAFPAMIIGSWMILRWRWRELPRLMLARGLLLAALICLPWFWRMQQANPDFLSFFFMDQQLRRFAGSGFNGVQPFWFYAPVVLVGFYFWSFWMWPALCSAGRLAGERSPRGEATLLLLLHAGLIFVFFSVPQSKLAGYILPVLPPLALIIAREVTLRWQAGRLPGWPAVPAGVIMLGVAGYAFVGSGKLVARYGDNGLHTRLMIAAVLFTLLGLFALHAAWRGRRNQRLLVPALGGILICLTTYALQPYFAVKSTRGLAEQLKPVLRADDLIVNYYRYYQDLPIYLNLPQPVTVVDDWDDRLLKQDNWALKLYMGYQRQPESKAWLIGEPELARKLAGSQRVFLFADRGDAGRLVVQYHLYPVTQSSRVTVLSNREVTLPEVVGRD